MQVFWLHTYFYALSLPAELLLGDDAEVGKSVDEELHGKSNEEQSHDADEDADAGFTEELADLDGGREDPVADEASYGDGAKDSSCLVVPKAWNLADKNHHG
jgi:hypothetical protein